mmetsp:Transcript_17351/g.48087  ORF Transcript_17351/g.48087 Transcript_17351/m.48087 type:complete len:201 (-) Transcript_17351:94-696(-)
MARRPRYRVDGTCPCGSVRSWTWSSARCRGVCRLWADLGYGAPSSIKSPATMTMCRITPNHGSCSRPKSTTAPRREGMAAPVNHLTRKMAWQATCPIMVPALQPIPPATPRPAKNKLIATWKMSTRPSDRRHQPSTTTTTNLQHAPSASCLSRMVIGLAISHVVMISMSIASRRGCRDATRVRCVRHGTLRSIIGRRSSS